ncbi:MAG: MinD/ParA family protein [Nitrospirota bacterium]
MSTTMQRARVIAVTSGKGGVGKTLLTANLSYCLAQAGHAVLVVDADFGLANLDIMLNLSPSATLHDVIVGAKSLDEVIIDGPGGIRIVPAASGMAEYTRMSADFRDALVETLAALAARYDYVLLDTGAGISDAVLYTTSLADEVIIVATPDPTAMTDAYAAVKLIAGQQRRSWLWLLVNQASDAATGTRIAQQLQRVVDQFLQPQLGRPVRLSPLAVIPADPRAGQSVCAQQLLTAVARDSKAALAIADAAQRLQVPPGESAVPRVANQR